MKKRKINKDTIPERTKSFKISTRITLASVLGIVIPILVIAVLSTVFINSAKKDYIPSTVSTKTYGLINQLQWNSTISSIADCLASDDAEKKLEGIKNIAAPLEDRGTLIYIEENSAPYYQTAADGTALDAAGRITPLNTDENSYYYSDSGIAFVTHAQSNGTDYLIVIFNPDYNVPNAVPAYESIERSLTAKLIAVLIVFVLLFIIAIVVVSLITSRTIVDPINKIARGANEIAKGNLDYEIQYQSKNELGQLAESFDYMRKRLKRSLLDKNEATQQQKEMVAGIAHDLRTPLTSVKGYMEGLRDGIADTPEKQKRYLQTIYASTCDMEKMLDDLLTVSKLELGTIELHRERVSVSDFKEFATQIGMELLLDDFDFELADNSKTNPALYVDTDRFSRVIDNIISNSVKYRREGVKGKICLSISEYEHSIIFEVADNGMGVEPESLPRIFDTLYRADKARSNVSDGSGLGLSVCKQLVELHGGMIWAQNNSMGGLSIFISLPKYEESED